MSRHRALLLVVLTLLVIAAGRGNDARRQSALVSYRLAVSQHPGPSPSGSRAFAAAQLLRRGGYLRMTDEVVGYSLRYPRSWKAIRGAVGGTEFAAGARCKSAQIVDFQGPPQAGSSLAQAFVLQSFVQVCAKELTDGSSIKDFMRRTYGSRFSEQFKRTRIAGVAAYRQRKGDQNLIFLQASAYRIQVYSAVVAGNERRKKRLKQVRRILHSFALTRG